MLDFYDDLSGSLLRRLLPDMSRIPIFIKQASTDVANAEDESFALLLSSGGEKKRKFACVDPGNTALSVLYFMETKDDLPEDIRKSAAHNLVVACRRHNLDVPPVLEKQAGLTSGERALYKMNLFVTDIRESEETVPVVFKTASGLPLDTIKEAHSAIRKFREDFLQMHPQDRRAEALSIEKRASAFGLPIPSEMAAYTGDSYSNSLWGHIKSRVDILEDESWKGAYGDLFKMASQMQPDVFAEVLAEMDTRSGISAYWDSYILDPFTTTLSKKASEGLTEYEYSDGMDKVTGTDLQRLARNGRDLLQRQFGEDIAKGFCGNPVAIFQSLPQPQRKILMRMAQDNNFPGEGNHG